MKWIEFIGPSGAGKSFLYEKLKETRSPNSWITPNEGYDLIYEKLTLKQEIEFKKKFINSIKKHLFRRNTGSLNEIPFKFKKKSIDEFGSKFNFLSEMMIKEFANVSKLESRKKIKTISWYYEKRLLPFIVLYAGNLDNTIVFSDGIFHNNLTSNIEKYLKEIPTYEQIIFPDAVIFFGVSPQLLFERIINRNRSGIGTFIQRDLTDDQIKDHVQRTIEKHADLIKILKKSTCKVLKIDSENNIMENCSKIDDFISELNRKK